MTWIVGDRSGLEVLTPADHLYYTHVNQFRQSLPSVIIGRTSAAHYPCDGVADSVEWQAAANAIDAVGGGLIFVKPGIYNFTARVTLGSNTHIVGEDPASTIIRMGSGLNLTPFGNKDTTNGNSRIHLANFTIDQQGTTQSSGGGMSFTGLSRSTFENLIIEKSRVFNLFVGSLAGTALTGTFTFTNGDSTVTGSGTSFTTQLAVGDIIRSAGNHFQRVRSIASNTSLELDRAWGWATESGVTAKRVPANSHNKLINCEFKGTVGVSDNVGLGLFDDGLIQGCTSTGSTGYGFGPDHANRVRFLGNSCYDNSNAGIGAETVGDSEIIGNNLYRNGVGVYLLSGSYDNVVAGNHCDYNTNGIAVTYNSTSFPRADGNKITGNTTKGNTTSGINVDGVARTEIMSNTCTNNGVYGIRIQTGSATVPEKTKIGLNTCYDNQDTKTQTRGIYVNNGSNTHLFGNTSYDADHVTAGITDSGTNTTSSGNITT